MGGLPITFDDLQFTLEKQWAYYFDFSSAQAVADRRREEVRREELRKKNELLLPSWNPNASEQDVIEFLGIHYAQETMSPYKAKAAINEDLKSNATGSKFAPSTVYDSIIEEMFPREFASWKTFRKETKI